MKNPEKQAELIKYRDLVVATIQYRLKHNELMAPHPAFDIVAEHHNTMLNQTHEHFIKGRLTMLKHWFRDLTEMYIEVRDIKFGEYLKELSGYDIFESFFKKVEHVITQGKITTDNQFYDVSMMVDYLCQAKPVDNVKINLLNNLLIGYEEKKAKFKAV